MGPRPSRRLAAVLISALILRLAHWWAVRGGPFFAELAMDSQEYDAWARRIAGGDWLGSETFFQAPLYPYFLAVVYRLFGPSYDVVYLLQILVAVAACYALYRAGRLLATAEDVASQAGDAGERHRERLGLAAAALAAFYAPFVFYDVQLLKESLAVSCVSFLLWAILSLRASRSAAESTPESAAIGGAGSASARWIVVGLLFGVLVLLRENALLLVPPALLLTLDRPRSEPRMAEGRAGSWRPALQRSAWLLGGLLLVLLPVAIRNGVVGGSYLPTTFQAGTNFYIGNNPTADGTYRPIVRGKQIPRLERAEPIRVAEQDLGRELTAAEVSSYWLDRGVSWARAEPVDFLQLQARKLGLYWRWYEWPDAVDYAWVRAVSPPLRLLPVEFGGAVILAAAGLWMRRRHVLGSDLPIAIWIVGWTASTVIFFVFSRYRIPMVPALLLWAAVPVARFGAAISDRRRRRVAAWGALLLVALWLPRFVAPPPRLGLVHYNLGVLHQQAGRLPAAEAAFRSALEAEPDHFLAAMNLGRLAASRGDLATAEIWLRRAVELAPDSDDARANLGALHLAAGRFAAAEDELRRALEINPRHLPAQRNLSLLESRRAAAEAP